MSRWTSLSAALLGAALCACSGQPAAPAGPPPDTAATGPGGAARLSNARVATFQLSGSEGAVGFRCTLDGAPVACSGTQATVGDLADGRHTFTAAAVDAAGAVDPSPAVWEWTLDTVPPSPSTFSAAAFADHLEVSYPDPAMDEGIQIRFGPTEATASTYMLYAWGSPMTVVSGFPMLGGDAATIQPCQEYWVTVAVIDAAGNVSDPAPAQRVVTTPPAPGVQVYAKDGQIVVGQPLEGVEYLVEYGAAPDQLDGTEAAEGPSPVTLAAGGALHGLPAIGPRYLRVSQRYGACVGAADPVRRVSTSPWRPLNAGPTAAELMAVACSSATSCVAAGAGGVAFATADGATWSPTTFSSDSVRQVVGSPAAIFAHGFDRALHRSTDGGVTWSRRGSIDASDLAFASADRGYATTINGIFRTADGGLTWELRNVHGAYAVAAVPGGERAVAVSLEGDVLVSADRGATWTASPITSEALLTVTCPGAARCLAGGAGGVLLVSDDAGDTWTPRSTGLTDAIVSLAFGDELHGWALVSTTDGHRTLQRTADGGGTWEPVAQEPVDAIAVAGPSSLWVVGVAGLLARTDDGGGTWTQVGHRRPVPGDTAYGVGALCLVAPGTIVAAGSRGALRSVDDGATWTTVAYPPEVEWALPQLAAFASQTFGMVPAVERGTGRHLFLRTFDGGATWSLDGSGEVSGAVGDLACIAAADPAATTCHAVAGQALYRSTDGGASWTRLTPEGEVIRKVRFLDAARGFMTKADPAAPSPPGYPGQDLPPPPTRLHATVDGGDTWSAVEGGVAGNLEVVAPSTVVQGPRVSFDAGATWTTWSPRGALWFAVGAGRLVDYEPNDLWSVALAPGGPDAYYGAFPWEGPIVHVLLVDADRWLAVDLNGVIWLTETGGR